MLLCSKCKGDDLVGGGFHSSGSYITCRRCGVVAVEFPYYTLGEAIDGFAEARTLFNRAADRVDHYLMAHPNDPQAAKTAMAKYDKASAALAAVVAAIEANGHKKKNYAPDVWEREQFMAGV